MDVSRLRIGTNFVNERCPLSCVSNLSCRMFRTADYHFHKADLGYILGLGKAISIAGCNYDANLRIARLSVNRQQRC